MVRILVAVCGVFLTFKAQAQVQVDLQDTNLMTALKSQVFDQIKADILENGSVFKSITMVKNEKQKNRCKFVYHEKTSQGHFVIALVDAEGNTFGAHTDGDEALEHAKNRLEIEPRQIYSLITYEDTRMSLIKVHRKFEGLPFLVFERATHEGKDILRIDINSFGKNPAKCVFEIK